MAIAKITGNGLISIAILVACLWGCLLAEHKIMRESRIRQNNELIQLRHLRDSRLTVPASMPVTSRPSLRPVAG